MTDLIGFFWGNEKGLGGEELEAVGFDLMDGGWGLVGAPFRALPWGLAGGLGSLMGSVGDRGDGQSHSGGAWWGPGWMDG